MLDGPLECVFLTASSVEYCPHAPVTVHRHALPDEAISSGKAVMYP